MAKVGLKGLQGLLASVRVFLSFFLFAMVQGLSNRHQKVLTAAWSSL